MTFSVKAIPRLKSSFQSNYLILLHKKIGNRKKWNKVKKNQRIFFGIKERLTSFALQRISGSFKLRLREYKAAVSFYGNLKKKKIKAYQSKTIKSIQSQKLTFLKGESLLFLFETRLDVLLFRSGLTKSLYESRNLIQKGFVLVNGKVCIHPNFSVEILPVCVKLISKVLKESFKNPLSKSKHIFVNHDKNFFILQKWPNINEICFPIPLNSSVFFI